MIIMFFLVSCGKRDYDNFNLPDSFKWQQIVLFENEEHTFDIKSLFSEENIVISKYNIYINNSDKLLLDIKKNNIKPIENGFSEIFIEIYDNKNQKKYSGLLAKVVSVVESKMIEIKTYEDLRLMDKNKKGNYILKSDIDLKNIDFEPIGNFPYGNEFVGMLVNPGGYKIKNLTITSSDNVYNGPYGGANGALFGSVSKTFLYGLILEDVNIDVSDFDGEGFAKAAAIATGFHESISINNFASGNIKGQDLTGGLFGSSDYSLIYNNNFEGIVRGTNKNENESSYTGGVISWSGMSYVEDTKFSGEIYSEGNVGAISGYHMGLESYLNNNNQITALLNGKVLKRNIGRINPHYHFNWNVEVIVKK